MYNEMFSKLFEGANALPPPLVKTNKLVVSELEKVANFQMGVTRYYLDIVLNQLKAATEITDAQSLQAFVQSQVEVANTLRQKMMDDAKVLTDLGNSFKADFDNLAKDTVVEFTPQAKAA
jgi:phasin family protein